MSSYMHAEGDNQVFSPFDKSTTFKACFAAASSSGTVKRSSESLGSISLRISGFMLNPVNIQISIIPQNNGCTVSLTGDSFDGAIGLNSVDRAFNIFFDALDGELARIEPSVNAYASGTNTIPQESESQQPTSHVKGTSATIVVNADNFESVLKRVSLFLEDQEWEKADAYSEQILNYSYNCAEAYIYKLLAELRVRNKKELAECGQSFKDNKEFKRAIEYADESLKKELAELSKHNEEHIVFAKNKNLYDEAMNDIAEESYWEAEEKFKRLGDFQNAKAMAEECGKNAIYAQAISILAKGDIEGIEESIELLDSIKDWKNSQQLIDENKKRLEDFKIQKEREQQEKEKRKEERRIKLQNNAPKIKKLCIAIAMIAVLILSAVIVYVKVFAPKEKYNALIKKYGQDYVDTFYSLNVGDSWILGNYEQNNDEADGRENIEWIVLAREDNKIMIISKYVLDCQQYNTKREIVTWETSSLRKWLNENFINTAFNDEEKNMILTTTVKADKNPKYNTPTGKNTQDKIFLISAIEAEKYFLTDAMRQCKPTAYTKTHGCYTNSDDGYCWWWLRSPGDDSSDAVRVLSDGSILYYGELVSSYDNGVRPAMWITLK